MRDRPYLDHDHDHNRESDREKEHKRERYPDRDIRDLRDRALLPWVLISWIPLPEIAIIPTPSSN
jgi:hypothetical protein